ncbi:hypothetical protein PTKIN_Ptkin01aG0396200 [Pterospermum kingtungense]
MYIWFLIIISTLCISVSLEPLSNLLFPYKKPGPKLPPGPATFPLIGNAIWLRKSFSNLEQIIRDFHAKFGNIITVHIGSYPLIFVRDHSLAHQALVQNAAVFADRPSAFSVKINSSNRHTISTAVYGPNWRILRKNLTSEIFNPSRVRSYSHAREWVLTILKGQLIKSQSSGEPVKVLDHFRHALFCLLAIMCFGDKLDEEQIRRMEVVQRDLLVNTLSFNMLEAWPRVTKVLFYKLWRKFLRIRQNQEDLFIPLIRAGKMTKQEKLSKGKGEDDGFILSYVDTLLELQLPEEKRKLNEGEIISLCSEFFNAGTDTTSTALQWIMANLVKYPRIQEKLFNEIKGVVGEGEEEVKEDDLQSMPYLKAVILEGLRRHPPSHLVLPHKVTRDIILNDFLFTKKCIVNFMLADMGLDPKVWEDPIAFKPERFLNSDGINQEIVDITCSKEIKMMPFGAGRRICPGIVLAMLHLEYFVANLVWSFAWKAVDGDDVDLSEKKEFTTVMKTPLQAHLYPRSS